MSSSTQRYIVMDTETTGLYPHQGDRITEIGGVEMIDNVITGRVYQQYINPEREVSRAAQEISGLTWDMLRSYPTFEQIVDDFLGFIDGAKLVIHNAAFDMKFLNFQLQICQRPLLTSDRVIDTLLIARRKFPGSPNNLDALCRRFEVSLEGRDKHGALLDSQLLAQVFVALTGGRQRSLDFGPKEQAIEELAYKVFPQRRFTLDEAEKNRHSEFMTTYFKNHYWIIE